MAFLTDTGFPVHYYPTLKDRWWRWCTVIRKLRIDWGLAPGLIAMRSRGLSEGGGGVAESSGAKERRQKRQEDQHGGGR
jgi:hypothetical protein